MKSEPPSLLVFGLLIVLLPLTPSADERTSDGFGFRAPPAASNKIGDSLWFGAQLVNELQYVDNLDLNDRDDDHLLFLEPELRTVLLYAPSARVHAYTELQLDGRAFLSKGEENDEKSEGHVRVKQLYLDLPEVVGNVSTRIGRQKFEDHRSWWYDEDMDMVKLSWKDGGWFATVSAGREKMFADDLARDDTDEKVDYFIVTGGLYNEKRDQTTLFLIKKNDRDSGRDEDPAYYGIQRIGEIGSDIRYWLDGAIVRGRSRGRSIRAYGVDSGFSVRFDGDWRPFLTLALAYGSGDNSLSDGTDGNFRQTDLEDNEARTFGITSYQYYGEVTDFELGNLWVGTLGIGVRPGADTSAELVYHHYSQADRDDDLFSSDLEIEPNGDTRGLGDEIDLIFAHRPNKNTKLSFTLGAFFPGDAFYPDRDTAWLVKLKVAYRF